MTISYISEEIASRLVNADTALRAVESVFAAMYKQEASNFPVVREALGYADAVYGFKSGFDKSGPVLGVKAGGYWPRNYEKGLANHQSAIVLFDAETGQLKAIVAGNRLTALRTAAASAMSIKYLARKNAQTLSIIGAGGQAEFQIRAAVRSRNFTHLMITNRSSEKAHALARRISDLGLEVAIVDAETAVRSADVLITIVSSWSPLVQSDWVRAGTHIACMGTDTKGKQEVAEDLVARAQLYTDEISQSISIGECQHAYAAGLIKPDHITPIGAAIVDASYSRQDDEAITLFDSTGVGLQDLAVAQLALDKSYGSTSSLG